MAKPEVFNNQSALKETQANFNKTQQALTDANKKWEEVATEIDGLN